MDHESLSELDMSEQINSTPTDKLRERLPRMLLAIVALVTTYLAGMSHGKNLATPQNTVVTNNVVQLSSNSSNMGSELVQLSSINSDTLASLAGGFDFDAWRVASENPHIYLAPPGKDVYAVLLAFMGHIHAQAENNGLTNMRLLDVGGNSGKWYERDMAKLFPYTSMDFWNDEPKLDNYTILVGNVLKHNDNIADGSYQFVTTLNVFEHLVAPWLAADEIIRITAEGGYMCMIAPFQWRYHAYPMDTLRYSHTELRYLFERNGGVKTLYTCYQHFQNVNGHYKDHSDLQPDPTHWMFGDVEVLWCGQKVAGTKFYPDSLDHNSLFTNSMADGIPITENMVKGPPAQV